MRKLTKITAAVAAATMLTAAVPVTGALDVASMAASAENDIITHNGLIYAPLSEGGLMLFGTENKDITSVEIPEEVNGKKVTRISMIAFYGCDKITNITIPAGVTEIGASAFIDSKVLTSISVDPKNGNYCSVDGILYSKDKTKIISCPIGKAGKGFTIPNGVTEICAAAFGNCESLTEVNIPNSVTQIDNSAFSGCTGLTSINIPDSVTIIDMWAFNKCSNLTDVTIPKSVSAIGTGVFYNCTSLKNVYYAGSKSEWNKIDILDRNDFLKESTISFGSSSSKTPTPAQLAAADVNGDNTINVKDATDILKMSMDLLPKNGRGDVNSDGFVNVKDATEILKYTLGLLSVIDDIV